jgi:proteic killer suppression protein
VIRSFHDKTTAATFLGKLARRLPADVRERAKAKLAMIHAATRLYDLNLPPSNHLESLRGDRVGQHSIRITRQWRVCFTWKDGDAYDVEITDYH